MHLTVLALPDCPNAPVLEQRLAAVLKGSAGVSASREVISTEGEAARWGMHGSPTLLIGWTDPFGEPACIPEADLGPGRMRTGPRYCASATAAR
jgi:hypothetical protein